MKWFDDKVLKATLKEEERTAIAMCRKHQEEHGPQIPPWSVKWDFGPTAYTRMMEFWELNRIPETQQQQWMGDITKAFKKATF